MKITNVINRLDAHHKLIISVSIAAATFFILYGRLQQPALLMTCWLAYCFASLLLSWTTILSSHPADVKSEVHAQDSSRTFIFLFALIASFASIFAILFLLRDARSAGSDSDLTAHALLSFSCIVSSWFLVHTIFTLRYAHLYYCDDENDIDGKNQNPGGLEFPGESQPDYLDFTYFAFVVGMTFQVSDVQITSRQIRRLALLHGLLSFTFNTILVALTINILSGLIQAKN